MNRNANITRVDNNVYSSKFSKFYTKLSLIFPILFHVFKHHITVVRLTLLKWNQLSCPGVPMGHLWVSVTHIDTPSLVPEVSLGPPRASCSAGAQVSPLVLQLMCSPSFQLQTQPQRVISFIEQIFLFWGERTANSWRCHVHFIDDLGTDSPDPGLGDPQLFLTLSFQQTHSML